LPLPFVDRPTHSLFDSLFHLRLSPVRPASLSVEQVVVAAESCFWREQIIAKEMDYRQNPKLFHTKSNLASPENDRKSVSEDANIFQCEQAEVGERLRTEAS